MHLRTRRSISYTHIWPAPWIDAHRSVVRYIHPPVHTVMYKLCVLVSTGIWLSIPVFFVFNYTVQSRVSARAPPVLWFIIRWPDSSCDLATCTSMSMCIVCVHWSDYRDDAIRWVCWNAHSRCSGPKLTHAKRDSITRTGTRFTYATFMAS